MVPLRLRPPRSTIAAVAALLLVGGVSMAGCLPERAEPAQPARSARSVGRAEHVVAGTLHGRTGAFLTVPDAASRVQVMLAVLPGLLYRISTPAGSGLAPRVTSRAGRVSASLRPTGGDGPDEVRIVLNRDVRWDIRLPAGAGEQQLDLAGGRVTRVDLGASGLVEMRLPEPAGVVPVTFDAGAGSVALTFGAGTPLRIRLDGGSGRIVTPWAVRESAAAGTVLESPEWSGGARGRYLVRARSGLGVLTLRRSARRPGDRLSPHGPLR